MDNNYAEQAILPFTVGRKNFVLMESSNNANASAMMYSIVETAKTNQLNVYQYLECYLQRFQNIWIITISDSSTTCFPSHLKHMKSVQACIKNPNFSKYKYLYQTTIGPAEI